MVNPECRKKNQHHINELMFQPETEEFPLLITKSKHAAVTLLCLYGLQICNDSKGRYQLTVVLDPRTADGWMMLFCAEK